ncbi:hypothetical protein [Oryza sativa Japonica Group]|uniref:Uncharacterized protein P0013F10.30 n=1 Tax=Oryza sativa subsp. japonica TaxID=39947 RepID=Q5VRV3_ORYSJ|nr:hypothetical protein [Oryza sativa Japonica Group]
MEWPAGRRTIGGEVSPAPSGCVVGIDGAEGASPLGGIRAAPPPPAASHALSTNFSLFSL